MKIILLEDFVGLINFHIFTDIPRKSNQVNHYNFDILFLNFFPIKILSFSGNSTSIFLADNLGLG